MSGMRRAGVLAVMLLLAVVADGQCPSQDQFDTCVSTASLRYTTATGELNKVSSCYKNRACQFLKDVYFCVKGEECCSDHIISEIVAVDSMMPLLESCDARNPCASNPIEKLMPAGCCPASPGVLASRRVCCRSADCSLCNKTVGQFVLNNTLVAQHVHLRLEATEVGTMCPDGVVDGAEKGVICNKQCSGINGGMLASTNNDYVYHALVASTVPHSAEECADCCVLSFDTSQDLSCDTGCSHPDSKCYTCHTSNTSTSAAMPLRCKGYDDVSCGGGGEARCAGHACMRKHATFSWFLHESVKVSVMAPYGQMYSWTPAVSGWLVLRYQLRFELDRRTCCPYTATARGSSCCGGRAFPSMMCAGDATCLTPSGAADGQCVADCDCPFGVQPESLGAHPDTIDGHQPCWAAAGITRGSVCRIFEINLAVTTKSFEMHAVTGFTNVRTLESVLADANPTLTRSTAAINKIQVGGAGMILDVELAAEVAAGNTYSFAGTTFTVYDATHAALREYMCPETYTLPLKPSALTLRSYVLPYKTKVLDPVMATAAAMTLVEGCENAVTCVECAAFRYNTLSCEWQPFTRLCVPNGTTPTGVRTTIRCGTKKPMLEKGVDSINIFDIPIVFVFVPALALLICTCCCQVYKLKNNKEAPGVHLNFGKSLQQHEQRFTEARRGDARMIHQRKVPRKADGQVEYTEEVMHARLHDVKTPYHMMDPETLIKHYQLHGYNSQG